MLLLLGGSDIMRVSMWRLAAVLFVGLVVSVGLTGQASAQSVEVIDGDTDIHCDPTCVTHLNSEEIDLFAHIPFFGEVHQHTCDNEYTLTTDENGEGALTNFVFTEHHATPNPCGEIVSCEPSWPLHMNEVAAGVVTVTIEMCRDTPLYTCDGDFTVQLQINGSGEVTGAEAAGERIEGTVCGISGDWGIEEDLIVNHV